MSTETSPPTSFKDHFSGHAQAYAAGRPTYPAALAKALADRCARTELALDCGCGSGQLSLLLASHFGTVVAIDPSAAQIRHAVSHPRVEYAVAPAEHSGLPDHCADLIVAAQAAHWFDLPAFWTEVRRVARPEALCALVTYNLLCIRPDIDARIRHYHDVELGDYWPPERASVTNSYRDIDFPFAELAFPALEITLNWTRDELLDYLRTWSALKRAEQHLPASPLVAMQRDLEVLWPDRLQQRVARFPLTVRCGRVS
jgi:SAM-dependent methyltransferase